MNFFCVKYLPQSHFHQSVMNYLWFSLTVIFGLVSGSGFRMTEEEIADFATIMEIEIPGSVDYLTRWAQDEAALDNFERILNGQIPAPTSARFRGEMCMFILSTNPRIEPEEIVARLNSIGITASVSEMAELVAVARAPTRLPVWLYNLFLNAHTQNSSWRTVYPEMERNINYFKRRGWIASTDRRFKGGARRWYTMYFLWEYFCIEKPFAASLDPVTQEWVMSEQTQQDVFRYTAISMNKE